MKEGGEGGHLVAVLDGGSRQGDEGGAGRLLPVGGQLLPGDGLETTCSSILLDLQATSRHVTSRHVTSRHVTSNVSLLLFTI